MLEVIKNMMCEDSHNPYFNRWFSAIPNRKQNENRKGGHNPYFNRWFSAIAKPDWSGEASKVTILILIDGFLQCYRSSRTNEGH